MIQRNARLSRQNEYIYMYIYKGCDNINKNKFK